MNLRTTLRPLPTRRGRSSLRQSRKHSTEHASQLKFRDDLDTRHEAERRIEIIGRGLRLEKLE